MTSWRRLSVRTGDPHAPEEPYKGIEPHMAAALGDWIDTRLSGPAPHRSGVNEDLVLHLAMILRCPTTTSSRATVLYLMKQDPAVFLDLIDAALFHIEDPYGGESNDDLRRVLEASGSVWTVAPDGRSLVERLDSTTLSQVQDAIAPDDEASEELAAAWRHTYGRNPDPSDAWDHATKAVEAVYIPLVIPRKVKANLGGVIGELRANQSAWETTIIVEPSEPLRGVETHREHVPLSMGQPRSSRR